MNVALIMVVVYLVGTTLISVLFSRKASKNASEYFVAERSITLVMAVALLFSEIIAGAGTIGNAATAFSEGLSSVWANWGMTIGCFLFVLLVAKFYRAMGIAKGAMSVPQAYSFMFDNKCRMVLMLIVALSYTMMFSTQAVAAASIVAPLLGMEQHTTVIVWVITALFIVVTITGGRRGIAWMNVVHSVVMYVGMAIVAIMAIVYVGGFTGLIQSPNLTPTHFDVLFPSPGVSLAYGLGTGISFLASSVVANVSFSAKTYKISKRSAIIAGIIVVPFALMPAVIGLCAKVVLPNIAPNTALFAMANHMGSLFGGLVSMAILAAIWSTAPSLLLMICTTLTKDLYQGIFRPNAGDKEQLNFSRIVAVVIGIVGTVLGLSAPSILNQMLGAFQIRSVVGIVLVVAIFCKRVTPTAAFWSILCGGVVAAGWHFAGNPLGLAPLWPTVIVCLVVMIPITLASKQKVSEGYKTYQNAVTVMEAKEREIAVELEAEKAQRKRNATL